MRGIGRVRAVGPVALGERRVGRAVVCDRIRRAEIAGEARAGARPIHDQIVGNLAGDRRAVLGGDGRAQHHPLVAGRGGDVGGPRRPQQGKAPTEQESVAGVGNGGRIVAARRVVELAEYRNIAAVVDLVEQRAVAARGIDRTQQQEFGAEFDQAAIIARRQREVGNGRIRRGLRIEREESAAAQLLVGAGRTEFGAGGERLAAQNFDPLDLGSGRRRDAGAQNKRSNDDATVVHAPVPTVGSDDGRSLPTS